jgi:hypothetical protein
MKTMADCFKYADKIGAEVGPAALAAAVANNNRQRPLRFAEICRVNQVVAAAENERRQPAPVEQMDRGADDAPEPARRDLDILARLLSAVRLRRWRIPITSEQ